MHHPGLRHPLRPGCVRGELFIEAFRRGRLGGTGIPWGHRSRALFRESRGTCGTVGEHGTLLNRGGCGQCERTGIGTQVHHSQHFRLFGQLLLAVQRPPHVGGVFEGCDGQRTTNELGIPCEVLQGKVGPLGFGPDGNANGVLGVVDCLHDLLGRLVVTRPLSPGQDQQDQTGDAAQGQLLSVVQEKFLRLEPFQAT